MTAEDVVANDGIVGDGPAERDVYPEVAVTKADVSGAIDHRIVLITNDPETALTVPGPVKATRPSLLR